MTTSKAKTTNWSVVVVIDETVRQFPALEPVKNKAKYIRKEPYCNVLLNGSAQCLHRKNDFDVSRNRTRTSEFKTSTLTYLT